MSVWRRFWVGLKGWFQGKNAGEFAGALLVFGLIRVMTRGLAFVCRGLRWLLRQICLCQGDEPRHGYGEPRPIKADLAKNRFLTWGC